MFRAFISNDGGSGKDKSALVRYPVAYSYVAAWKDMGEALNCFRGQVVGY